MVKIELEKAITESSNENKVLHRDSVIDIMKGVGIILLILYHFECIPNTQKFLSSFLMPMFFLISGYFHKRPVCVDSIKKEFKRLVLPFYFTMGILLLYTSIVHFFIFSNNVNQVCLMFWALFFPTGSICSNSVPIWVLPA